MADRKPTFEACIVKGYFIKVAVEIHNGVTPRMVLNLTEEGIFGINTDINTHMALDIRLPRAMFKTYRCTEERCIEVNSKHFQKQLKNIKKKESLTFFIANDCPNQLGIKIMSESSAKTSGRFEVNSVAFMTHQPIDMKFPGDEEYHHPKSFESNDFLKLKKMTSDNKIIKQILVRMQKSNYLTFSSDNAGGYRSEIGCGTIDEDEELYEKQFKASHFNLLIKMSSLTPYHINFQAPIDDKLPLKISAPVGASGGELIAYLKHLDCIMFEESKEEEAKSKKAGKGEDVSSKPKPGKKRTGKNEVTEIVPEEEEEETPKKKTPRERKSPAEKKPAERKTSEKTGKPRRK